MHVAFGADRRDLFGGGAKRLELRVAIGAQRVGLLLRGAERVELRVAVGANRLGLLLRAAQRVEMGIAIGADGVGLPRGVFQRIGQRGAFELAGRALLGRLGAHRVELFLRFDAIELEARLGFLERERARGARRGARFVAGRVREPLDQLADRSRVSVAGAGERGGERLAAHVDGDAERFELGQRRLGGLRDQRPNGRGGLGLRVVVERRGGVVWGRRRRIHLEVRSH